MERCKTCRWWDSVGFYTTEGEWQRDRCTSDVRLCHCDKILEFPEMSNEGRETYSDEEDVLHLYRIEQDEAMCLDGSMYMAKFVTGPEFGCIHWQAKEGSDG